MVFSFLAVGFFTVVAILVLLTYFFAGSLAIISNPSLAPGTNPFTVIVCFSRLMPTRVKLRTVTRSLPMRPAMRLPLNTRPGVVVAPIDPGALSRSDCPCVRGPPLNPYLLIALANPLPLLVPVTRIVSPTANIDQSLFLCQS